MQMSSRSFGTNETQQLRERQLVGREIQARAYSLHGAARHSYAHAQYIHSLPIVYHCVCGSYRRSLALAVQCETMHGVNACI